MFKFAAVSLALILASMTASAGFFSSQLSLNVSQPPPVPLHDAVVINGTLNFTWSHAIIPMPLVVYIEAENVPDWLSVTIQPSSFTITPTGWRSGSVEKYITITLRSKAEAPAFVTYNVVIHAFTNGSLIINGAEDKVALNVMQDFNDAGIWIDSKQAKIAYGESKEIALNVTNNCNSPIYVTLSLANETKFFDISFPAMQLIPSHATKSISIQAVAKKIGKETIPIKVEYYPPNHEEKKDFAYTNITLESYGGQSSMKAISIGIIIVIIASIIIVIWKRR